MKTVQTDVAIIGAVSAGLPAYRAAKAAGASAILIEEGLRTALRHAAAAL